MSNDDTLPIDIDLTGMVVVGYTDGITHVLAEDEVLCFAEDGSAHVRKRSDIVATSDRA